ncbi:hypothetical protein [Exiguobacterium acetylicum]|uniref:hypothetical protein n=1 Tax=Exiguobacterium acetylicum TaxID=41170 RepID=UPI001CA7A358|nr:hypothetical protein [Exiguobacterium acetylicum]QZY85425.1 hypothetical protein K7G97_09035 [Exiguobacterium acetylicum]
MKLRKWFLPLVLLTCLASPNAATSYVKWTVTPTGHYLERLQAADIPYKVRQHTLYIQEKDLRRVTSCCT